MRKITRALVSVSDKTGIVDFCRALHGLGVTILSTGGTAALLRTEDIPVTDVSACTGFPEIMDGRVKTLHPKIHGALLGRRGVDDEVMAAHGIEPIDLLIVNLYPFAATVSRSGCTLAEAIENIDIGGPAMLRAAAKNHAAVGVVVDNRDYLTVLEELSNSGCALSDRTRFALAQKAFAHTAAYDANVANYLGAIDPAGAASNYPQTYTMQFVKKQELRYGENPHQSAALYMEPEPLPGTLAGARQIQGKDLSYNNLADSDAALECALSFAEPVCVIVKHANPCGVALGANLAEAYDHAYVADPTSAFGGVIAFNGTLDGDTARAMLERQFVEVVLAPEISAAARRELAGKPNVRVLETGGRSVTAQQLSLKRVSGGLLVQDIDQAVMTEANLKVVTKRAPTPAELVDLEFAWKVVKYVKSNAIVFARERHTIGIGGGQTSRVYSVRLAAMKAGDQKLTTQGAVMGSDAFFPFRDGIDTAAAAGITAVIQPGGSQRDAEVIAAADEHGMAMVFTGIRHFLH